MSEHGDGTGARFGMWLFLLTEIMLFGGLFVAYAAYYYRYHEFFVSGGRELELHLGAANTVILLVSSFTVVAAIVALERGSKKISMVLLAVTIVLGALFLCNKYVEWNHKIGHGIYPNSELLAEGPQGRAIFFGLYFTLTGLHALHVTIGIGVIGTCLGLIGTGAITPSRMIILENSGLYWHLVDIIWIFLFPLFYLMP